MYLFSSWHGPDKEHSLRTWFFACCCEPMWSVWFQLFWVSCERWNLSGCRRMSSFLNWNRPQRRSSKLGRRRNFKWKIRIPFCRLTHESLRQVVWSFAQCLNQLGGIRAVSDDATVDEWSLLVTITKKLCWSQEQMAWQSPRTKCDHLWDEGSEQKEIYTALFQTSRARPFALSSLALLIKRDHRNRNSWAHF